jgi:hypothetical protein
VRFGRWVLVMCRILAIPAVGAVVLLHYDTSLAHRLGSPRIGAVTVTAATALMGAVYAAWTNVQGLLGALKQKVDKTYTPVREENERRLDAAAKDLGAILRDGADEEIGKRGLKNPTPLPVRWRQVATAGSNGSIPQELAGVHVAAPTEIARLVRDSARGRFVLIGEPGSGKTAVTLFLQRDLIDTDPTGPIPFTVPLSTWNTEVELLDWAAAQLEERFPQFADKLSDDSPDTVAKQLLRKRRIRLVLDAMDELPDKLLTRVFTKINDKGVDFPVLVTCRTADYQQATARAGAAGESRELTDAQVFELLAPRTQFVERYLGETQDPARWAEVFAWLRRPDSPLAQALSTPLMVWLTRRVYYRRRHPDELAALLEQGILSSREEVENHLLDELVPTVYRDENAARKAQYFRFIAQHVKARTNSPYQLPSGEGVVPMVDNGQDIAWWRLVNDSRARLTDTLLQIVVGGLIPGGCVALGWATSTWNWLPHPAPLISGLVLGVICTVAMAAGCLSNDPPPTGTQFGRPGNFRVPVIVMGFAIFVGGAASLAMSRHLTNAPFSLIVAMPVAVAYTFTNPYVDADRVSTPLRHYRADIQQTVVYTVAYGIGVGVLAAIYRPWPLSLPLGLMAGIAGGFTYGAVYKIAYGRNMPPGMVAWVRFRIVHLRLALTGKLPWAYFKFLEDAHRHGVLRQSGGTYQFSHVTLRDRLALEPAAAERRIDA